MQTSQQLGTWPTMKADIWNVTGNQPAQLHS